MYYFILLIIVLTLNCWADEQWDQIRSNGLTGGKIYNISSGTGFFVANHYIITNNHVVEQCLNISIRGAVVPSKARIVNANSNNDLALLYTDANNTEIANFRANDNLKLDDMLTIIGYPLTHAEDGTSVVANSKIIGNQIDVTKTDQLEFIANVEHGNSGGPLLDSSGNVIGVIQGIKKYYREYNNVPETIPFKTAGIAIGIDIVENFLKQNSVYFYSAVSSDLVNNYNFINRAKNYIVNIHCVK